MEIGNSVFMEYVRTDRGLFVYQNKRRFCGGLERIAAAAINNPDVFRISLMWPIVAKLEQISTKDYDNHTNSMRVITDHLRAASFLAVDGVTLVTKSRVMLCGVCCVGQSAMPLILVLSKPSASK